jgi:hypothetical protein
MNRNRSAAAVRAAGCWAMLSAVALAATAASPSWQALLEDHSAAAWSGWKTPGLPTGWQVAAGVLSKSGPVEDLVSNRTYRNFELEFEWKIGKEGNGGVFYRGTREYDHIYWSGPEYQLLDDANAPDGRARITAAGSAYALYGAPAGIVMPFDHWNRSRLVVHGNHVEHWLNGHKVVEYELGSDEWKRRVAASKFSAYPHYGTAAEGLIGLQGDHPGALSLRRIRIRELP